MLHKRRKLRYVIYKTIFFFNSNKKDVFSLVLTNKFVNLNLTKPQTFETKSEHVCKLYFESLMSRYWGRVDVLVTDSRSLYLDIFQLEITK